MSSFDIGGGGGDGSSFQFNAPGWAVTGRVLDMTEVQQTNMDKEKTPAFWDAEKTRPKMMYAVRLQTDWRNSEGLSEPNPFDDGVRTVYLKGSKKPESQSTLAAVLAATKAAGCGTQLQVGGTLTLTYIGDGPKTQVGFNAPKLYSATYVPATTNLDPAPPAAAPVPTPPPAAPAAPAPAAPPVSSPMPPSAPPVPTAPVANGNPGFPTPPPAAPAPQAAAAYAPPVAPPAVPAQPVPGSATDAFAQLGPEQQAQVAAMRAANVPEDAIRQYLGV